tara:strand:- start:33 stop:188 length:156 start_codon:yes stop_codon:yes gene_type:complete
MINLKIKLTKIENSENPKESSWDDIAHIKKEIQLFLEDLDFNVEIQGNIKK